MPSGGVHPISYPPPRVDCGSDRPPDRLIADQLVTGAIGAEQHAPQVGRRLYLRGFPIADIRPPGNKTHGEVDPEYP